MAFLNFEKLVSGAKEERNFFLFFSLFKVIQLIQSINEREVEINQSCVNTNIRREISYALPDCATKSSLNAIKFHSDFALFLLLFPESFLNAFESGSTINTSTK